MVGEVLTRAAVVGVATGVDVEVVVAPVAVVGLLPAMIITRDLVAGVAVVVALKQAPVVGVPNLVEIVVVEVMAQV